MLADHRTFAVRVVVQELARRPVVVPPRPPVQDLDGRYPGDRETGGQCPVVDVVLLTGAEQGAGTDELVPGTDDLECAPAGQEVRAGAPSLAIAPHPRTISNRPNDAPGTRYSVGSQSIGLRSPKATLTSEYRVKSASAHVSQSRGTVQSSSVNARIGADAAAMPALARPTFLGSSGAGGRCADRTRVRRVPRSDPPRPPRTTGDRNRAPIRCNAGASPVGCASRSRPRCSERACPSSLVSTLREPCVLTPTRL